MLKSPELSKAITSPDNEKDLYILADEEQVNVLSYRQFLLKVATNPDIAIQLIQNPIVEESLDGLDLSILGSIHERVALSIFSIPALREKLLGPDLGELGAKFRQFADCVLADPETKSRLKSYHLAAIGDAHPELAEQIKSEPELFGRLEYIHYGLFSKSNHDLAKRLIEEKSQYMEGVEIANIAKHHEDLALSVINNQSLRGKIDTESLVILANTENIARAILNDPSYFSQIGPIGVARVLAKHEDLAIEYIDLNSKILLEFEKISTACIIENNERVATRLYHNDLYRSRNRIEDGHVAWIEHMMGLDPVSGVFRKILRPNANLLKTFEQQCIGFMLKNRIQIPMKPGGSVLQDVVIPLLMSMPKTQRRKLVHQLIFQVQRAEIDEIVALGNQSLPVALDVLKNYRDRLQGADLVLLGQKFPELANVILSDANFSQQLTGIQIVMLAKSNPLMSRDVLLNPELREKVVGCHAGVLALKDPRLLHLVLGDNEIKSKLTQKDVPLLCKRYIGVMKLALQDKDLYSKFSSYYYGLLEKRAQTVQGMSDCIRSFLSEKKTKPVEIQPQLEITSEYKGALTPLSDSRKNLPQNSNMSEADLVMEKAEFLLRKMTL